MKILKLLLSSLVIIPVVSINTISCANTSKNLKLEKNNIQTTTDEDYYSFIFDRTFSIQFGQYFGMSYEGLYGTGWIFKHITNGKGDNYRYYMLTNWHIINQFEENSNMSGWRVMLGQSDHFGEFSQISPYYCFEPKDFEIVKNGSYKKEGNDEYGIDASICYVDFGDEPEAKRKQSLDRVNEFGDSHNGMLEEFNPTPINDSSTNLYCAGYPILDLNDNQYDQATFCEAKKQLKDEDGMDDTFFNKENPTFLNISHNIYNSDSNHPIYSMADCYTLNAVADDDLLLGYGSDGAMVIDSNFNVIGILWGTVLDEDDFVTYHCVDMLADGDKYNFINEFLNSNSNSKLNTAFIAITWSLSGIVFIGTIITVVLIRYKKKSIKPHNKK